MADRLDLEARFNDRASAGVKRLGKTLDSVKPSNGMAAATAWMKDFRGAAEKANVAVQPVTSTLTALGVGGLAASMSMSELVKSFKGLADGTLNMKELGRQSGMTIDQINRLQYAAGKLHVDPSAISGALNSWSDKMVEFRRHGGRLYSEMMRQNSDVAAKIISSSPEEGFKRTLDFLSRIPAAAMKAGKSAGEAAQIQKRWAEEAGVGDVLPMMADTDKLKDAFVEAGREVKPISEDLISAAERLNDSTNRLGQSWKNLTNDIGPKLIDPLTGAIDKFDAVLKEGEKLFNSTGPEFAPPPKSNGTPSESTSGYLARTLRNTLRVEFSGDNQMAKDGQWLWKTLFGTGEANAGEMPAGGLPRRVLPPAASDKWIPSRYDLEARARAGGLPVGPGSDLRAEVREGSKAGIIAGLREMAQQQDLDGGAGGAGGAGINPDGGVPNMRRGRSASGKWRSTPGTEGGAPLGQGALGGVFKGGRSAQAGVAKESYDFWRAKGLDHNAALSMVAQEQGESGFDYRQQRGDSGLAHGAFSWHPDRRAAILRETGINIDQASHLQQLEAAWHEGTKGQRAGFFQSLNGRTLRDAVYQGVHRFEGSRYQQADTNKRLGFANSWDGGGSFLAPKPPAGAGLPAPSAAAVGDAAVLAARQRILNGSHDPADRALVERYQAQQNTPGHAAGGLIRGPGGPTADRIPAMLSDGEFVVRAGAAGRFLPLLHAINGGQLPGYATGGPVRRGSGITPEGRGRIASWMDFFMRPDGEGGMGATRRTALGAIAMMQGESGRNLDPTIYQPNDVDGPSGGSAQWHDVTRGRMAGKLRRFSDLMDFATAQHADWKDIGVQQAFWKREARNGMRWAWDPMRRARTAPGTLKEGIDKFENPSMHALELRRRLPNIAAMVKERVAGLTPQNAGPIGPLDVNIHHHPHTGKPMVRVSAGTGLRMKIRTGPTMRPT